MPTFPTPFYALLFLFLFLLTPLAHADCECGYTVSSALYTDLLETDFLHLPNITLDTDWEPQNYTVSPAAARGPYGKNATIGNVIANPLQNNNSWAGEGVLGGDPGLQLWVRGGTPANGLIPMAEVASAREDMLYGSFRAAMKLTGTSGTCGAFFWVHLPIFPSHSISVPSLTMISEHQFYNNTQEIDFEFLSRQFISTNNTYPVNLVLQSPASAAAGFNAADTPTFTLYRLPFAPDTAYHEYRFDWSPSSVDFYADSVLLTTMNVSVPSTAGSIHLSQWSNGDPTWSGGPPSQDAVVTVEYFKGYFNSSNPSRQKDWTLRCKDPSAVNATCPVPNQTVAPDGNSSANTFFFSKEANMTVNQTVYGTKESGTVGSAMGKVEWALGGVVVLVGVVIVGILD
ncbi:hypothetical protein MMC08_008666 [Hypocenomyce scalaris]|nr:hypothetical protein [Hypocenomyce scalaris]